MKLYGTINNVNRGDGGAWNNLHVLRVSCDAPPTKWQCSRGADLLIMSEYSINKHLTGVKHKQHISSATHTVVLIATKLFRKCKSGQKGCNPLLHQIALLRIFYPKGITTNQLYVWQFSNCGTMIQAISAKAELNSWLCLVRGRYAHRRHSL